MAHLLIVDLPGGEDIDILAAAWHRGDRFSFITSHLADYLAQPACAAMLARAEACLDVPGFDMDDALSLVRDLHARQPIDAVICLIDIRLVEAATLARALGTHHISPACARLLRDKHAVRAHLQARGIAQPAYRLAESNEDVARAVDELGLPLLIKPADGYGSQNIVVLREPADLDPWVTPVHDLLPSGTQYGLGVRANDRLVVERFMSGTVVGCDTFSAGGRHTLLGVNDKTFHDAPSFAIRGGCFTPRHDGHASLERAVFALLDAVGFDWGAAHVEMMLTEDGPRLIEINARLVGARLPRLLSHALGRPVHEDLIDLHLGCWQPAARPATPRVAVTRWVTAPATGRLRCLDLPAARSPAVREAVMLRRPGDRVRPPLENADRLGYVMTCASDRATAEREAEAFVAAVRVEVGDAPARGPVASGGLAVATAAAAPQRACVLDDAGAEVRAFA